MSICQSALLVSEDFSYGTGGISGANGGTGWSGAWGVAGSGNSLIENVDLGPAPSGYAYDVVPNALRLNTGGNTQEANRSFATPLSLNPDVQTTYYFSTMFARVDSSNGGGTEGVRLLFGDALLFGFTSTELPSITHVPSNTTVTGTPAMTFTNTLAATPRYLLLGKMVANPTGINDEFYFSYFNSTDNVAAEPAQWQVSLTSLDLSNSLGSLKIQAQNFSENTYWDNFYLGTNYASVVNNNVFDVAANETITISEVIDGTSALTKTGLGELTLTGDNTYTGSTTVNSGLLELASLVGGGAASTSSLSVASGATLLISQSNQVSDAAAVTLSGGTIQRGAGVSEVFGNLNVGGASALDFGLGATGTFQFQGYSNTESALITLQNFLPGNKLQFLATSFGQGDLSNFSFGSFDYSTGTEGSYFTITAIPEPSTHLALAGLIAAIMWPSRRKLLQFTRQLVWIKKPLTPEA